MRNPNPTSPPPPRPHDPPKRRKIDRPEFFDDPHPAPAPATAEAAAAVASGDPVLSPPRKNPGFFRKPDKEAGVVAAGVVVVAPPLPSSGDGKGKQRLESGRNADIPPKKEATEDEELNETRQRIGEPADARRKQTPKPGSSSFSSKGAEKPERALVDFRLKDGDHSRSGSNQKPVKREPVEYDARYKGEVSDAPGIGNRGKRDEARPSSAKGRTGHEKGVDRQTGWHRDDLGEEGLPRRMKSKGEIVKDTEQETRAESKGSHSQQQRAKRESRWDESMASKHPWHGRGEDRSAQNMFERETETLDDRNRDGKDLLRTTREDSDVWDRLNDRRRDSREEDDKGGKQKLVRERLEDEWEGTESRGRSSLKTQGDDEDLGDKGRLKDVSGFTWDEQEDRRRSGGGRFGRGVKSSWSPEGRRNRGDNDDHDREWPEDRKEIERERGYRRDHGKDQDNSIDAQRERGRERETFREREFVREKDSDLARDRSRTRDREDTERWKNRQRDRPKDDKGVDGDYFHERGSWEFSNRERDKSERDWSHRNADERDRKEKGRASPQSSVVGDAMEHGGGNFYGMDPNRERGFAAGTFMGARRGQSSGFAGDSAIGNSDGDWSGGPEERVLSGDGFMPNDGRERYTFEEEGPPGLDQRFGDGGMSFGGLHNGRAGRGLKGAPGQRGRGGQFNDGRPAAFVAPHQGAGMMMRGMQQGGKGGRGRGGGGGGGGGAKGGRGGPRDVQRGGGIPMPYMGPGMPPHFGPMPNMGPNMGSGPIGPGGFPLPSFGGPVGWGGGGEMGMLPAGPPVSSVPGPRFGPAMGPGPNPYFNMPGPARVGMNPIPGSFLGEYSGPSPMVPEKSAVIRLTPRINAPPGRAPSRGEQNDYAQHFVDTGLRPQNFIRDVDLGDRFEEYPKLKELIARKDKLIQEQAFPPMYLQLDLHTTELTPEMFGTKFDVILVDPPWEEYVRRAPGVGDSMEWWAFEEIMNLRIEAIADTPSFIFLWVGDAEGLDHGRMCLKKWGFRRCEDICWVKTNRENPTSQLRHDSSTLLHHSKEHCLMGIKGTVRRSTDSHIIHANIDTDIIISEEPPYGSTLKPEEMYHIIEHFALGQRRLELFGEDHNIRAGWLTVGKSLTSSNFNVPAFAKYFADGDGKVWQGGRGNPPVDAPHLVGTTPEIEALRPKSPPPRTQQPQQSQAANSASGANSTTRKLLTDGQGTMPLLPTPTLASVQTPPNSSVIVISSSSPQGMQSQVGKPSQVSTFNTDTAEDDKGMMGNLQEAGYADGEVGKHMQNPKDVASL